MDPGRTLTALAVLVAVVAFGTVAGGLAGTGDAEGQRTPGLGIGSGSGSGIGDGGDLAIQQPTETPLALPNWLTVGPLVFVLWASLVVGVVAMAVLAWQDGVRRLLELLASALGRVLVFGLALAAISGLLFLFSGLFGDGGGGLLGNGAAQSEGVVGDAVTIDAPSVSTGIVIVATVALFVLVVLALARASDGDRSPPSVGSRGAEDSTTTTATRLPVPSRPDEPGRSNEVYRAWGTLRDQVGRNDRAETPAELRRRALAAGYDERAVRDLTALFAAVRYGDAGPTPEHERRARKLRDGLAADQHDGTNV